jgi:hypothetical protein
MEDIRSLAYEYLCRPDKLGLEPGCVVRDSRFGYLHDLDTEDVECPLDHSTCAKSRRIPVNTATRAKKSDEKDKKSRKKRKLENAFGDEGPALKHLKLKRTLQG